MLGRSEAEGRESDQLVSRIGFSTGRVPPAQRSEAWRGYVDAVVDMTPVPGTDGCAQIEVDLAGWHLGDFLFIRQHSTAEDFRRHQPTMSSIDHWLLVYKKSGSSTVMSDDIVCATGGDVLELRSLSRPFVGMRKETDLSYLVLPRDLFPDLAGSLDSLHNSALEGPLSAMLKSYMCSLEEHLGRLTAKDVPRVAQATRSMIAACIVPNPDRTAEAESALRQTLLERARQYVRANLRSPGLTPVGMAKALHLSRTQLYRLFENQGGVARYIRRQRLRACREALALAGTRSTIKDLAHEFGFTNHGEFSRSFRAEFGFSPREVSENMHGSLSLPLLPKAELVDGAPDFRTWLLGLAQ